MKIKGLIHVFILTLASNPYCFGKPPDWYNKLMRIRPLVSNKADIEKIFENSEIDESFVDGAVEAVFYITDQGQFRVYYATGECSRETSDEYKVEKGKVINVFYSADKGVRLSKFNLDLENFEQSADDAGTIYYLNKELGVKYGTQDGKLLHTELFPSSRQDYLKCGIKQ